MPNVTRPIETQRLVPPTNAHVQSTCDPSFAVPGYVSGVQQRFDYYDTHPELFPESRAINSTDPWDRIVQERSLPRPIMTEFDGNPMNYQSFVRQFTAYIAKNTQTDDMRLLFLLQHCKPDVRENIERFTFKDPTEGYRLVWQTLFERYGQPHVIAQCCEQHLKKAPDVKPAQKQQLLK